MTKVKQKSKKSFAGKRGRYIFIFSMLVIPIIFFLVFNVGVKFNSIILSFQEYDAGIYRFVGFKNFQKVFNNIFHDVEVIYSFRNSFIFYVVGLFVTLPVSIFTTYLIYKKVPGSEFFKVMAFLPQMLSTIIMTLMYKYFVDKLIPIICEWMKWNVPNVFYDETKLGVMLFYNIWVNLGANIVLYIGAMNRIPEELIEVGVLEGITLWKEFWLVTFPLIFPTITVFIVAGVAGLFTNQCFVYNFYGNFAPQDISTLGYYMFVKVVGENSSLANYPYASAFGVIFTLVAAPITLLVKYLLEKFGPGAEF